MNNLALAFSIFITNPVGLPAGTPNTASVYERYTEPGQSFTGFATEQQCMMRLAQVKSAALERANDIDLLPQHRSVLIERAKSMRCLSSNAAPPARLRVTPTNPGYVWKIGRIDVYGWFEGYPQQIGYFADKTECDQAYARSIILQQTAMTQAGVSSADVLRWKASVQGQYRCMMVAQRPPVVIIGPLL